MKQEQGKKRLIIFIVLVSFIVVLLVGRFAGIMLFETKNSDTDGPAPPLVERGPILDRNAEICAIQTRLKSAGAWIPSLENVEETEELLSGILSIEKQKIADILEKSTHKYVFIKRKISPTESDKIIALQNEGKLKGIVLNDEFSRSYPHGKLVSHLIGYVDTENNGLDGIELSYDSQLSPPATGAKTRTIFGNQLFLSIDIQYQYMIRELALKAYNENDADSIMVLLMNAKTGELLSYVSIPDFNPNEISKSTEKERANLPIIFSYEPGSVFKIFSLASILESGGIATDDEYFCNGTYERTKPPITCLSVHGRVTPADIIKYSCNVGAAYASETIDPVPFYRFLTSFGFGQKTGIPLPGETVGIFKSPSDWSKRTKPAISFGQEISVSALQLITAATVFTNEGNLLEPIIVRKIVSPDGKLITEYRRRVVRRVVSPQTASAVLRMMETATVGGGTARFADVSGIKLSAKTGTAEIYDRKTGKYSDTHFIASIIGIFPTDDPRYIAYIVIDHPRGDIIHGSRIAAPVLKAIIENLISMTGLAAEDQEVIGHSGKIELKVPHNIEPGNIMPDLTGYPKRLLISLFKIDEISVSIRGEGYVVRQSPPPGTEITKGMKIVLELE